VPLRPVGRVRSTRQAAAIETALDAQDGFRTAQQLFAVLRVGGDRTGLTTVYRHLNLLARLGRADVVHTADGELQFRLCGTSQSGEGADAHHHHVVCRVCGRSVEVSGPQVEVWAEQVAAAAGYPSAFHRAQVLGMNWNGPTACSYTGFPSNAPPSVAAMATTPGAPFNGIPMIGLAERPSACSVRPPKRPWLLSGSVVAPRDSARSADARLDGARRDGVGPPLRGTPGAGAAATGTGAPKGTATFTGTVPGSHCCGHHPPPPAPTPAPQAQHRRCWWRPQPAPPTHRQPAHRPRPARSPHE